MIEEWRDIPGHEGKYQASSFGRIRSIARESVMKNGRRKVVGDTVLSPSLADVYQKVTLYRGGVKVSMTVHAAVAYAFLGERPAGMVVCHSDGNRNNNAVLNLRYATQAENVADSILHGVHPLAKLAQCARGHDLAGENLIRVVRKGSRRCKICNNLHAATARAKKRDSNLNPQERKVIQELHREREAAMLLSTP